jgi:hypothetical protein
MMRHTNLDKLDKAELQTFSVSGQIQNGDGDPLVGVQVRTIDKQMRSEVVLGEATTTPNGRYEIKYIAWQLASVGCRRSVIGYLSRRSNTSEE